MGSIRLSDTTGNLFMDFRYGTGRCREYTALADTPANRKRLEKVLDKIEAEIAAGTFDYAAYFPNSKALKRLAKAGQTAMQQTSVAQAAQSVVSGVPIAPAPIGPVFKDFANTWFEERSIEWRRSHTRSLLSTLNGRLIPYFGRKVVGSITKSDILDFRATLAKVKGRGRQEGLSAKRINEIMGLLRQIINEAADRFDFKTPYSNIKKLRQRKTDVQPFSIDQMQRMIATVRMDYKPYLTVRFLTGMRTAEVNGLKWKYVDFERRLILVRETHVLGESDYTKTDSSQRDISMSQPVYDALKTQFEATGEFSEYVFCNMVGEPLDNKNFSDRVWYPLLRHLGLEARRPYQMRHTAATLWLAAGEAPEWIAKMLGHSNTTMLFSIYSRFVPNLTRQDGSAMERLLASKLSQGALIEQKDEAGRAAYVPANDAEPQTVPKARGIAAKRAMQMRAGKSDAGETSPDANSDLSGDVRGMDIPTMGSPRAQAHDLPMPKQKVIAIDGQSTGDHDDAPVPRDAQPPPGTEPLSWADLARSWMGGEEDGVEFGAPEDVDTDKPAVNGHSFMTRSDGSLPH